MCLPSLKIISPSSSYILFVYLFFPLCVSLPNLYEILWWVQGRQLCQAWIFIWNIEIVTCCHYDFWSLAILCIILLQFCSQGSMANGPGYSPISPEVAWFSGAEICHCIQMTSKTLQSFTNSAFTRITSTNTPSILCQCFVAKVSYLKACQTSKAN